MLPPPRIATAARLPPPSSYPGLFPTIDQIFPSHLPPPKSRVGDAVDDFTELSEGQAQANVYDVSDEVDEDEAMENAEVSDDPIAYVRGRLKLKDYRVEALLLRLLQKEDQCLVVLDRCITAGGLLTDLHFLRGSQIPTETVALLKDKLSMRLEQSSSISVDSFRAMFGAMGRLALYGKLEPPTQWFTRLTHSAKKVFLSAPATLFILYLCIGRLTSSSDWDVAKHYFSRALSLAMTITDDISDIRPRLKALLKSDGRSAFPVQSHHRGTNMSTCLSRSVNQILNNPISSSVLDELF